MPKNKSVVITFGRFNPPTTGHAEMFRQLVQHAARRGAEALVFPTVSEDPKKNPLPFKTKVGFLEDLFPDLNFNNNPAIRTPIDAFAALSRMGYTSVHVIVGSDREAEFRQFAKYIVPKGRKDREIVIPEFGIIPSSDKRSTKTISASKLRAAATSGDFATFQKGTPTNRVNLAKAIYKSVREHMGVNESKQRGFLLYGPKTLAEAVHEATTMTELTPRDILLNSPRYAKLLSSKLPFAIDVTSESYVTIRRIHGLLESAAVVPTVYLYQGRERVMTEDKVKLMTTSGMLKIGLARDIVEVATSGRMVQSMIDLMETSTMRVGAMVYCTVCGDMKKPIGRSGPMGASYCDNDCPGYRKPPYPGSLWPGETEDDFGYPIGDEGTKRVARAGYKPGPPKGRLEQVMREADQQKTAVGLKPPSEIDRMKATQKQQEISLKSRQAQELLQAKQRELAKKTRDDMNKIKTGEKPAGSPAK